MLADNLNLMNQQHQEQQPEMLIHEITPKSLHILSSHHPEPHIGLPYSRHLGRIEHAG
ncbi:hypothetical protein LDC_2203, partial [sediment metagenome]